MKECQLVVSELMRILEKECRMSIPTCNNTECLLYARKKEYENKWKKNQDEFERIRGRE